MEDMRKSEEMEGQRELLTAINHQDLLLYLTQNKHVVNKLLHFGKLIYKLKVK